MKVKSTRALRSTAHAAVIKSRSGCLLRKQITMIIPDCHPLTALKHPSIKPKYSPIQTNPSLSCIITPSTQLLLPRSLHTFHSSQCVNCLPERLKRRQTLWPASGARSTQPSLLTQDQSEKDLLGLPRTAVWSDTAVRRRDCSNKCINVKTNPPLNHHFLVVFIFCSSEGMMVTLHSGLRQGGAYPSYIRAKVGYTLHKSLQFQHNGQFGIAN